MGDEGVGSMRAKRLCVLWLFALAIPCFATTTIVRVEATQMQAKITVRATAPDLICTYRASRGTSFSGTNLPDLVDNGDNDGRRPGSISGGFDHVFVLGTRRGPYALANSTTYWVGAACGSDAEVSTTFTTLPIPWGNMAPDPVPFDATKFGNMDYPLIDWSDRSKSYVDPVTGIEFWRLTGPAFTGAGATAAQYNQASQTPVIIGGANWASTANLITNGASFAVASGGSSDKLFIPFSTILAGRGWQPIANTDDALVNFYCGNGSQAGMTFSLQLSLDSGQTVGTTVTTGICPTTTPVKIGVYPQTTPAPIFVNWLAKPPQHNLLAVPRGTVSVASSVVTVQSPVGPENYFPTEWKPGSLISINGVYEHIASVQSPTQLTITENPGTLTNVPFLGAASGFVLTKNGTGSVSVSVGVDTYGSSVADTNTNGDIAMVNAFSVSVTKSADGLTTLSPALKGYLTVASDGAGAGCVFLYIPYNADGSPRNETRLLSVGSKVASAATVNLRGDSAEYPFNLGVNPSHASAFDGVSGVRWFGVSISNSGKAHFFRMTYDETLTGCAGYPAYNPYPASGGYNTGAVTIAEDCFQYYNLTPTTGGLDIRTQMVSGYQTGLNSVGAAVGPAHTGFDLGWMGDPAGGLTGGGYLTACMANRGEHLCICAAFDPTGLLTAVRNFWGGDAGTEVRWGGIHGISYFFGSWRWATLNGLDDNTGAPGVDSGIHVGDGVFNSAFDMPVAKVNRAGYGATPAWTTAGVTNLTGSEAYTCPPDNLLPVRYQLASMQALGYTGSAIGGSTNCVQMKVTTPPCNATPNSTYIFPSGHTEKDEFPCSTPGFGVANANRSKLMDIQPGDWMWERAKGYGNERFVALTVTYNGTNDIDIWVLRWARHNYLFQIQNNGDDYLPSFEARSDGWFLSMGPSLSTSTTAAAIDFSQGAAAKLLPDNPDRVGSHGVFGAGASAGTATFASLSHLSYMGQANMAPANMLFKAFTPVGAGFPMFAGSASGSTYAATQNYNNATWLPGSASPPFQLDWRHINPGYGSGSETTASGVGNARTATLVSGTTKTYLVSDGLSAGASDYKRLPLHGWAGHFLLQDISSATTGNTADFADWRMCRAFKANECFAGSTVGNLYVTVPRAFLDGYCHSDSFTIEAPCAVQLSPYAGQVVQFRTDKADTSGLTARKFGYVHGFPGLQYQFSNCRATPDAAFAFCVADWLDGIRSEWVALKIGPQPPLDGVNRTTFVPITLTYQGSSNATYIRARFGYLENSGNGSLLNCTAYQVECSTEIPSGAATDPYSFTNEAVTRQPCAAGTSCKITIPALPNRMLYYVVDRLDGSGAVVMSYPMQVMAVP